MSDEKLRPINDSEGYTALASEPNAVHAAQELAKEYLAMCADERAGGDWAASGTKTAFRDGYKGYIGKLRRKEDVLKDNLGREEKLGLHMAQYIIASEAMGATGDDARKFIGDWATALPKSSIPTANKDYL